jgi:hypothetical protein
MHKRSSFKLLTNNLAVNIKNEIINRFNSDLKLSAIISRKNKKNVNYSFTYKKSATALRARAQGRCARYTGKLLTQKIIIYIKKIYYNTKFFYIFLYNFFFILYHIYHFQLSLPIPLLLPNKDIMFHSFSIIFLS